MERRKKVYTADTLPFAWDAEKWGRVEYAVQECPGVYYVCTTYAEDLPAAGERYAVTLNAVPLVISPELLSLGVRSGNVRVFAYTDDKSPYKLVDFELRRYRARSGQADHELGSVYSDAAYLALAFPDYFGELPPPTLTPWGLTIRRKKASEGVFFLETDRFTWTLALACPIWENDLLEPTIKRGVLCQDGLAAYDEDTRYLFFRMEDSAPVLYELLRYPDHQGILKFIRSKEALETYLCEHFPEYVESHNAGEYGIAAHMETAEALSNECDMDFTPLLALFEPQTEEGREALQIRRDPAFAGQSFFHLELAALFGL